LEGDRILVAREAIEVRPVPGRERLQPIKRALGREHLRDPYFTLHAARALGREDAVSVPPQYERAF
jgi:hypothetical protein